MKKTGTPSPRPFLCVPLLSVCIALLGFGTAAQAATPVTLTAKGVYAGEADSHTVEIRIAGKARAFQLPAQKPPSLAGIRDGSRVKIEYKIVKYPDGFSQWVLLKIKKY